MSRPRSARRRGLELATGHWIIRGLSIRNGSRAPTNFIEVDLIMVCDSHSQPPGRRLFVSRAAAAQRGNGVDQAGTEITLLATRFTCASQISSTRANT